jgi:hypothetical protein
MAQKVAKEENQPKTQKRKTVCTVISWILIIAGAIPLGLLAASWIDSLASGAHFEINIGLLVPGVVVFCAGLAVGKLGHRFL